MAAHEKELQINWIFEDISENFSYFLMKTYVVTPH